MLQLPPKTVSLPFHWSFTAYLEKEAVWSRMTAAYLEKEAVWSRMTAAYLEKEAVWSSMNAAYR
jgi:hypothetical protein